MRRFNVIGVICSRLKALCSRGEKMSRAWSRSVRAGNACVRAYGEGYQLRAGYGIERRSKSWGPERPRTSLCPRPGITIETALFLGIKNPGAYWPGKTKSGGASIPKYLTSIAHRS